MTKYRIHITKKAERDLARAAEYINDKLKNPWAAERLLENAEREINTLTSLPERHALVADPLLAALGVRFVRVGNYLAFYRVSDTEQTVTVIRFLYGRSSWVSILRQEEAGPPTI